MFFQKELRRHVLTPVVQDIREKIFSQQLSADGLVAALDRGRAAYIVDNEHLTRHERIKIDDIYMTINKLLGKEVFDLHIFPYKKPMLYQHKELAFNVGRALMLREGIDDQGLLEHKYGDLLQGLRAGGWGRKDVLFVGPSGRVTEIELNGGRDPELARLYRPADNHLIAPLEDVQWNPMNVVIYRTRVDLR